MFNKNTEKILDKYSKDTGQFEAKNYPVGWVCPKCGTVHSPSISFCPCSMKITS